MNRCGSCGSTEDVRAVAHSGRAFLCEACESTQIGELIDAVADADESKLARDLGRLHAGLAFYVKRRAARLLADADGPGEASAELTPWMRGALDAMREVTSRVAHAEAGVDYPEPCPYGSGPHRASHTILARREWQLPFQATPLAWRVGAVLVNGADGDYAAYMAIADDDAWIADHGTKLGFTDAALLFPGIKQERYRP